jgi:predicted PurR-regulated permease PerM
MSRRQLTISVSSVALVVATGMLLLLLWQLRSLVLTVMIAVVVAAALAPLVDLAERLRIPRWLGVVLVYLSLIAGIAGLALLIGPTVATQTQRLLTRLPFYLEQLQLLVDTWIADLAGVDPAALDYLNQLLDPQSLMSWAVRSGQRVLVQSFDFTRGLLGGLLTTVLTLFISGYMLVSGSDLVRGLVELFPYPWNDRLAQQVHPMAQRMGGYIQGRVLVSAILGVMITVSLRFLGLSEFALALGVIAGFTNLIPFIGPVLGSLPALVVAIVQGGLDFFVGADPIRCRSKPGNLCVGSSVGGILGAGEALVSVAGGAGRYPVVGYCWGGDRPPVGGGYGGAVGEPLSEAQAGGRDSS